MNDTLFRSAAEAAELVRRKEVSARELTQLLLARIDAVNPAVNAVVELRSEEALQEAAEVDRVTVRGDGAPGPLHGVPMTVKESFNVAGLHTTWGNPAFKDYVANADATLVRRLKQAGAIIVGKTNVHFMLADFAQTANELYGVTNNPWDTARTPGGSSGGGAAALAAGMTFLEHGSDLGPRARPRVKRGRRRTLGRRGRARARWHDGRRRLARRRRPGRAVRVVRLPHRSLLRLPKRGADFSRSAEFIEQENRRMAARAAWSRYFDEIDVFLCPANFTPAFAHDSRPFEARTITTPEGERPYTNQPFWISHASLPGLPAVVAPIGRTPGGLPVGVQIIGPLYEDNTAVTFAEMLADVIGGYEPPPL